MHLTNYKITTETKVAGFGVAAWNGLGVVRRHRNGNEIVLFIGAAFCFIHS
jgi:hypothetical protein